MTLWFVLNFSTKFLGWVRNVTLPWKRFGHCAVSLGKQGVFVAGGVGSFEENGSKTAAIMNMSENKVLALDNSPSAKKLTKCALFEKKVYVGDEGKANISVYNLETKKWESDIVLGHRTLLTLFTNRGHIYVLAFDINTQTYHVQDLQDDSFDETLQITDENISTTVILFKDLLNCIS